MTVGGCGGGFGSGGFGALAFGSGAGLYLTGAAQYALNAVDVSFAGVPNAIGSYVPGDVLNPNSWALVPLTPGVVRLVQWVEELTDTTFRLWLDGTLTPRATYRVTAAATMVDEYWGTIVPDLDCRSAVFTTVAPARTGIAGAGALDGRFDLANPQFRFDAQGNLIGLGTLQIDDAGDLAVETGVPYLRKRITRRLSTSAGEFFHLPGYGVGLTQQGQQLARPALLRRLAKAAQEQIRQEPDVVAARVTASNPRDGVYVFTVQVRTVAGLADEFTTSVTIGSGVSSAGSS